MASAQSAHKHTWTDTAAAAPISISRFNSRRRVLRSFVWEMQSPCEKKEPREGVTRPANKIKNVPARRAFLLHLDPKRKSAREKKREAHKLFPAAINRTLPPLTPRVFRLWENRRCPVFLPPPLDRPPPFL